MTAAKPPSPRSATPVEIATHIREGDTIAWSSGAAEPTTLLESLGAQVDRVPPCRALIGLSVASALDPARLAGRIRVVTLGGAGSNHRFAAAGNMDVLPAHYSALPRLVADGDLKLDVILVQLASDGAGQRVTLMADYISPALPRARSVIAEINDQAPCILGDTAVSAADIDHAVHVSRPPVTIPASAPGPAARAIGAHVARLIGDGATLQVGLGALPDACLMALSGHRDLGLHSGVIGDRAADLVDAGVVTNKRKPIDTGLSVTAGLLGTERLYRWAHRHPKLRLRNAVYTHDTATHAMLPQLVGINSALEIDLTGQMNAEVAQGRSIGLIGGHGDFMRGGQRSPGGRAILALEATARGGKLSRIVPKLADGIVTSSRSDADVVVTEFGIAELRGRTVTERAQALIAIAHPDFRGALLAAAERLI